MGNSTSRQHKDTEQKWAEQVSSTAVAAAASCFPISALEALLAQASKQNGAGSIGPTAGGI